MTDLKEFETVTPGEEEETEEYLDPFSSSITEKEIELDEFEIVSSKFFAQIKEPAFTFNGNKCYPNSACVRMMPETDYVKFMINRKNRCFVLIPCDEMDIDGFKWVREKDGKRYPSHRTGALFILILSELMGWNPDWRYKILGKMDVKNGQEIMVFDLDTAQEFEKQTPDENGNVAKRSVIPPNWNGSFGPKYGESRGTLKVDTFKGYTVISINKDKKKAKAKNTETAVSEEEKPNAASEEDLERIIEEAEETLAGAEPADMEAGNNHQLIKERNEAVSGEEGTEELHKLEEVVT